jgi:glycosyltransferase involved in cell wall biosynthesis
MINVAYINPQSYSNLEEYDRGILSVAAEDKAVKVDYICNIKLKRDIPNVSSFKFYSHSNKALFKGLSYVASTLRVYNRLVKKKYDVVHIQWLKLPLLEALFVWGLKKYFLPKSIFIYTAHNAFPHDSGRRYRDLYKNIYRVFDHIFVHDNGCLKTINDLGYGAIVNKIDVGQTPIGNDGELDVHLSRYVSQFQRRFILVIGSASYYKGSDLIYKAWIKSELASQGYAIILMGKGYSEFVDQDSTLNFFVLDSRVSEISLNLACEQCFGFLLPYREISQSGVLMSIVGYEKPMLLSNVGALGQFISYFKMPIYISSPASDEISDKLKDFVSYAEANKSFLPWSEVQKYFSWESAAKETFQIYSSGGY